MNLHNVYRILLRLYPKDHQASFAAEMLAVFDQAATEHRRQGWTIFAPFAIRELIGLIRGAAAEWTNPSATGAMTEAQHYLDHSIRCTVHAIAHHDFAGARRYWAQEHEARAKLRRLCEQGNPGNLQS